MAKDVEINIKATGLKGLRDELKQAKNDIIDLQNSDVIDPAKMEAAVKRAGALKDQFNDVNEQIKVFSGGSDFEKVSNGLGLIGSQLRSLDFEGAAASATNLTSTIKSLNPQSVANGFKGLITVVGQLGNAFVQLGIKLLANPIFLIVAVIAAVVIAIVLLKDKVKILEQAFDLLMAPINLLIEGLKDLTDAIGITSFAEEEAAKQAEENAKRRIASNETVISNTEQFYARQIALLKAAGKDTTELEEDSLRAQRKLADDSFQITKKLINDRLLLLGIEGDAEISALIGRGAAVEEIEKSLNERKNGRTRAQNKVDAQFLFDQGKNLVKQYQDAANFATQLGVVKIAAAKKANDEQLKLDQDYAALRLKLDRQYRDLVISNMNEGFEKEYAKNAEKLRRDLEDLRNTKGILKSEREKISAELQLQADLANKKLYDDEVKRRDEVKKKRLEDQKKEQQDLQEHFSKLIEYQKNYDEFILEQTGTESEKRDAAITKTFDEQRGLLRAAYFRELQDLKISEERKFQLKVEFKKKRDELDKLEAAAKKQAATEEFAQEFATAVSQAQSLLNGLSTLFDQADQNKINKIQQQSQAEATLLDQRRNRELNQVGLSELQKEQIDRKYQLLKYKNDLAAYQKLEQVKKKQFARDKAFRLAGAVIDTASATIAAFADGAKSSVYTGIAYAAIAAAAGALQIAAISSQSYQGEQGPTAPNIPTGNFAGASEAATPTLSTNNRNANGGEAQASQTVQNRLNDNINISVNVGVDEVTNTQNRVARITRAAELSPDN